MAVGVGVVVGVVTPVLVSAGGVVGVVVPAGWVGVVPVFVVPVVAP